jgi:hypothetical protein
MKLFLQLVLIALLFVACKKRRLHISVESAKKQIEFAKKNNITEYSPDRLLAFSNGNRLCFSQRENPDTLAQQQWEDSLKAIESIVDEIKRNIDWSFITDSTYSYAVFENIPDESGVDAGIVYAHSLQEIDAAIKRYRYFASVKDYQLHDLGGNFYYFSENNSAQHNRLIWPMLLNPTRFH